MKTIISKSITLLFLCVTLFSFAVTPGGEAFEIYFDNELVLQRNALNMDEVKSLRLDYSKASEKLGIRYNHCGKVGKNRQVTIRDQANKILKIYTFNDASAPMSRMEIEVKDLLNIKKGNGNSLKLYYSSTELAKGRMLVTLLLPDLAK